MFAKLLRSRSRPGIRALRLTHYDPIRVTHILQNAGAMCAYAELADQGGEWRVRVYAQTRGRRS
jgi:hypothetical protein